jgi:hypothetical protein
MTAFQSVPVQGHHEFAAERRDLMRAFQSAREKAAHRPLPSVEPGEVAEGVFRSWLEGFLPSRYGVTSGYIISAGLPATTPMKHFDVIIYDKLETPVLWQENNPDRSDQGRRRPIPVENVLAVLEVKSTLTRRSAESAFNKLRELTPLLTESDSVTGSPYPTSLPEKFTCGTVFFTVNVETSAAALEPLVAPALRGWLGGIILGRAENEMMDSAGLIFTIDSSEPFTETTEGFASPAPMTEGRTGPTGRHESAIALFSTSSFAMFAFSLLSRISGRSRSGFLASPHGLGFKLSDVAGRDDKYSAIVRSLR